MVIVLVPLVGIASRVERRALLADRAAWQHGTASPLGLVALVSSSIKVWSLGNVAGVIIGSVGVVVAAAIPARASGLGEPRGR